MTETGSNLAFPLAGKKEIGYAAEQVDEFLQQAREAYDNPELGTITAETIRSTSFRIVKRGYSARFVDAAMDRLEEVFYERERNRPLSLDEQAVKQTEIRDLATEVIARAGRPKHKKFRRRGFLAMGYKRSQVDAFVERAVAGLAGRGLITASQVREALFHAEWRGYDEAQVDAYLDAVTELILAEH